MDPITLFSVLYKVASFSSEKQKDISINFSNQTSRTEIIELYRSTMSTETKKNFNKN